jgi:hypothetical protein
MRYRDGGEHFKARTEFGQTVEVRARFTAFAGSPRRGMAHSGARVVVAQTPVDCATVGRSRLLTPTFCGAGQKTPYDQTESFDQFRR